ncbi:MAG: hypothetical protein GY719_25445 [bacterium]|nr:hypothetical protein [bacterium]
MNLRLLVVTIFILLAGLIALLALQWKIGAGGGVTSPQQVVVQLGQRKLIGGGRAGVEFDRRQGQRAEVIVRCSDVERRVKLKLDQISDEICSVRIRLREFSSETGTLATSRAHLEVTWEQTTEEPAT